MTDMERAIWLIGSVIVAFSLVVLLLGLTGVLAVPGVQAPWDWHRW